MISRLWIQFITCMLYIHEFRVVLHNWQCFWAWFWEMVFNSWYMMSLHMFSQVLAQKNVFWWFGIEFWSSESNLKLPEFALSAQAKEVTLKRRMQAPSTFADLSSWLEHRMRALIIFAGIRVLSSEERCTRANCPIF